MVRLKIFLRLEAVVESDETFEEGELLNLTPSRGNVHAFTAVKDTVIFDVLSPYYDQETRFCNFYLEVDNYKPAIKNQLKKKVKKEVEIKDKTQPGFKTTVMYLFEPPNINFKVLPCSDDILKGPE